MELLYFYYYYVMVTCHLAMKLFPAKCHERALLPRKGILRFHFGEEDTGKDANESRLTNLLFSLFSSFVLLFSVLNQLCLLHQVRADFTQTI